MKRAILLAMILLSFAPLACKTDDASTKTDATVEPATPAEPVVPAEPVAPAEPAEPAEPAAPENFGAIVTDATMLTVSQRQAADGVDFGGQPRVSEDTTFIAKVIDAVGRETVGSDALPKCIPDYTLVFASPDGEMATFGGVCGGAEQVILVQDQRAYAAKDGAALRALIAELAKTEPVAP